MQVRSLLSSLHKLATTATSPTLLLATIGVLRVLSTLPLAATSSIIPKLGEAKREVEERCAGRPLLSSLHVPRVQAEVGEEEVRRVLAQGRQAGEDALTNRVVQFLKNKEGDAVGELRDGEKEESKTDSVSGRQGASPLAARACLRALGQTLLALGGDAG